MLFLPFRTESSFIALPLFARDITQDWECVSIWPVSAKYVEFVLKSEYEQIPVTCVDLTKVVDLSSSIPLTSLLNSTIHLTRKQHEISEIRQP
jgi:hypothetical protein